MRTTLLIGFLAVLCAYPAPKKCSPATCASGCCDATGACQTGDSASACGSGGTLCVSCVSGSCAPLRICAPTTGNGGGSGTDAGGRTVVFSNTVRWVNETGTTTNTSLGTSALALHLASGSSLTELPGTRTDTTYTVQNVPVGPYVVRYGDVFYVAQTDTLDVGRFDLGRPTWS